MPVAQRNAVSRDRRKMSSRSPLCRALVDTLLFHVQSGNGLRAARLINPFEGPPRVHKGAHSWRSAECADQPRSMPRNQWAHRPEPRERVGVGELRARALWVAIGHRLQPRCDGMTIRRSLLRWPSPGESDPADPRQLCQHCARPDPPQRHARPSSNLGVSAVAVRPRSSAKRRSASPHVAHRRRARRGLKRSQRRPWTVERRGPQDARVFSA
jgi:hypothetical protein